MKPSSENQPRRSRLKRVPKDQVPSFRITSRDKGIIEAVYTHRVLTTPQINALFFKGDLRSTKVSTRCTQRLRLLFDADYLARDEEPTKSTEATKPLLHLLDKESVPLLAEMSDLLPNEIDWKQKDNNLSWPFLEHLLATNDVRIAIELAAKQKEYAIRTWLDDKTLKRKEMKDYVILVSPQGKEHRAAIIPDGYIWLTDNTYDYHHFLEVDMGTETGKSSRFARRDFRRKILGYLEYYRSGKYEERYNAKSIRILTVTTSDRRLQNLLDVTENAGGGEQFWFTTFDAATPKAILTEPIWHVVGQRELQPLIW